MGEKRRLFLSRSEISKRAPVRFLIETETFCHRPRARPPTTLSEWQLLAVLHGANLLQYYETFIAQGFPCGTNRCLKKRVAGGDDVNQIMSCDETEFLEIMSLVGMLNKPLHVRRLQRTLSVSYFGKLPEACFSGNADQIQDE